MLRLICALYSNIRNKGVDARHRRACWIVGDENGVIAQLCSNPSLLPNAYKLCMHSHKKRGTKYLHEQAVIHSVHQTFIIQSNPTVSQLAPFYFYYGNVFLFLALHHHVLPIHRHHTPDSPTVSHISNPDLKPHSAFLFFALSHPPGPFRKVPSPSAPTTSIFIYAHTLHLPYVYHDTMINSHVAQCYSVTFGKVTCFVLKYM